MPFSRPPLGGIDYGAGGFAQRRDAALRGNDGEQRFTRGIKPSNSDEYPGHNLSNGVNGLEKLWSPGARKGPQRCRQFFKL
ncbi:hypothetical protein EDS67_14935 [candidate division KSB1 bacterium]|nr:MAG: hypothetical protein EDS67_14935 [candidate division KSB1 bacterium]MBC6950241.1 hypothetical protein [candidate division KSB1 bacterium]MCE7940931.1 hypothetical protein [Chlorobi bacterium CHB1]